MVCRIEDVDDLFKAFNGGQAADFTAADLAEQVWDPAYMSLARHRLHFSPRRGHRVQGLVVPGRCALCECECCPAGAIPSAQQAAWLQSEAPNLKWRGRLSLSCCPAGATLSSQQAAWLQSEAPQPGVKGTLVTV